MEGGQPWHYRRGPAAVDGDPMTRLFAILAAVLTLAIWAALLWWLLQPVPDPRIYEYDWPEKARITQRLKYHGIEGAYPDGKGWYYFYNQKGQRCRL